MDINQFAPDNRDADGRTSAAQFIKHAHTAGTRRDLIKDHFTAGNELSLNNLAGDTLRKVDRVHTALRKLAALGVKVRGVEVGHPVTHAGSLPTVRAMAKALRHPQSLGADFMAKVALPPEDAEEPDGELAATGAVNDWSTQGETASAVRADLLVGREHSAEQHDMGRGRTAVSADDAARASGQGGRERRVRTPTLPPPDTSAAGRAKNPNADDTVEAIKSIHAAGARPMWG